MTNNNIMGVRKVIAYPDLSIAIICLSRVSCSFLGIHFFVIYCADFDSFCFCYRRINTQQAHKGTFKAL